MRIVLDTNVLVSAIVYAGKPERILELVVNEKITGYVSQFLLTELLKTLRTKFDLTEQELSRVDKLIREIFEISEPTVVPQIIERDPADNQILALAERVEAHFVVSGDKDVLKVQFYKGISIVNPDQMLEICKNRGLPNIND